MTGTEERIFDETLHEQLQLLHFESFLVYFVSLELSQSCWLRLNPFAAGLTITEAAQESMRGQDSIFFDRFRRLAMKIYQVHRLWMIRQ